MKRKENAIFEQKEEISISKIYLMKSSLQERAKHSTVSIELVSQRRRRSRTKYI